MDVRTTVRVRVLAFARIRELVDSAAFAADVGDDRSVGALWTALVERTPELAVLRASTRTAVNGRFVADDAALYDGDEIALLPPVGGG